MEKVAAAGGKAGELGGMPWVAALLAGLAAQGVLAAEPVRAALPADAVVVAEAQPGEPPPLRMQVDASALPQFEAQEAGFQAPRVDLSVFPAQARGFGAVLGVSGVQGSPRAPGLVPARTGVDLGLRYSHQFRDDSRIDLTGWRRMNVPQDASTLAQMQQPQYGARVEMNLKPAKFGGLGIDRGLLGLQLESGARISIKRKNGGPMVYYRTSF